MSDTFETLPDGTEALRVDTPNFRRRKTPQIWYDRWRNTDRVMRFTGRCVTCNRTCYSFDDGENDPRGVLGDHSDHSLVASEAEKTGPDVVLCAICGNDYDMYQRAQKIAAKKWRDKPELIDLSDLREHKVDAEAYWQESRELGGDGYDTMDDARKHKWLAVANWGRDGWDFLEWPYYVGYVRNRADAATSVAVGDKVSVSYVVGKTGTVIEGPFEGPQGVEWRIEFDTPAANGPHWIRVEEIKVPSFEFATVCEGDVDVYRFDTNEARIDAMDRLAFWNWQNKGCSWVKDVYPDDIPEHLRGMYDPSRHA